MKYFLHKSAVCFLLFIMLAATRPAQLYAFTIGEEREMGEKLLYTVRAAFPVLDDPDLVRYINDLGDEVLEAIGVQNFDYHFYIVNDTEFNAFAAPSGLIFFYTGLIDTMANEDELVSVLAHEIGHVVSRHIASRMEKSKTVSIATLALALASLAIGSGEAAQALLMGSLAAGQAVNLHFSRLDEEESDLLSYGWMKKMGRDPAAMAGMLESMRRISRYRRGQIPQYLLTHPDPEARLAYVESLLALDAMEPNQYTHHEDFAFQRMKHRVLSMVKPGRYLRPALQATLRNTRKSEFDKIMATYGLSQLDLVENNFDSSLQLLDEVIAYFPDKSILMIDKGKALKEAGDFKQAHAILAKAYDDDSTDMYACFQLAMVLIKLKDNAQAKEYMHVVAYEMPEFSKVYYQLGKLVSLEGEESSASFYLGKYYLYEGRLKLAVRNFKTALQDKELSSEMKKESKETLVLIKKLME